MPVTYELVVTSGGRQRSRPYTAEAELAPGDVVALAGRPMLVEGIERSEDAPRAFVKPARYRLRLRHPDGHEELGAFRRYRPDAPGLGHSFTTVVDGRPASWEIVDVALAWDEGEPYLDLVAQRDWGEQEGELPNHELEHTTAARGWSLPEAAEATISRAERSGLAVELAALEGGEAPDWEEAERYIEALVLEEIEDDLLEQAGVNPDVDPRETWLETVRERLRSDLERFRADVEGDHDEIEEWDFRGGRVFASVGTYEDESNPDRGHGWMCRLLDASGLGAAGFERVRKTQLELD